MCFNNDDYDWYASVVDDDVVPVTAPVRCDECRRMIRPGEFRRHIFMQEDEYCRHDPDSGRYDAGETAAELGIDPDSLPEVGCPPGCEHDYGETYEYDRCETCDQLLDAIQKHELAEGCHRSESQPALEELQEAMRDGDGAAYLKKAEELYPGITARLPADFVRPRSDDED